MFQEFDRLMLIKSGELIYSGGAGQIVPYMQSLGIEVDLKMNPADFFMLEVSAWREKKLAKPSPMTAEAFKDHIKIEEE